MHKSEGMGTLGQQLGLAARDPGDLVSVLQGLHFLGFRAREDAALWVAWHTYVPGIGREEGRGGCLWGERHMASSRSATAVSSVIIS